MFKKALFKKSLKQTLPIAIAVLIGAVIAGIIFRMERLINAIPICIGYILGRFCVAYYYNKKNDEY